MVATVKVMVEMTGDDGGRIMVLLEAMRGGTFHPLTNSFLSLFSSFLPSSCLVRSFVYVEVQMSKERAIKRALPQNYGCRAKAKSSMGWSEITI